MRINLTDNYTDKNKAVTYLCKDIAALYPISDKPIIDLCKENEGLLVFPDSIELSDDKIGLSPILKILTTDNPDRVRITTGNIMGFIGVGNLQVKIQSRFDKGRDDYFLHYMLQKVLSFNLFDLNHSSEQEDIFDFIMFMFPYFLKNALRQGVYREYRNFKHNDANLRGTIDVGRHIARNIPFAGSIAYSTREYSRDNSMTELIRHTIEFMNTKKYGQAALNIDKETKENVKSIIEHTPSYNRNERRNIINQNLRSKVHPYYTEYRPLQMLCLQILRMEEVKYGESEDDIYGILFYGAWLWEEYVNTILEEYGFIHPRNKQGEGRIYLFDDRTGVRYPDFYKDDIVLDAKYKRLDSYERVSRVNRDDVHQVIAYMNNRKASKGGFLAPLNQRQETIPTSRLRDSLATMSIFGIEITKNSSSYADFCDEMKRMEAAFIDSLDL